MNIIPSFYELVVSLNRLLLGLVFIVSGLVKSIDPMGTSFKIDDYLSSFSMDVLIQFSPYISIFLCGFELLLGFMLLLNLHKRLISTLTLLTTTIFTILTIYIYIYNPVADCGCFGDAIILTNSETLLKNIVLLVMSIAVFVNAVYYYQRNSMPVTSTIYSVVLFVLSFSLPVYNFVVVPPVDFLPYDIGVNIPQAMNLPQDAKKDEYKVTLVYKDKESGELINFSDSDTTWYDDSKYEYVDTITKLIKKGDAPTISSFDIFNSENKSVVDSLMRLDRVAFLVTYDNFALSNTPQSLFEKWHNLKDLGFDVIVLSNQDAKMTAARIDGIVGYKPTVYNVDLITLKSFLRASLGIVTLSKGTITGKSNLKEFSNIYDENKLAKYSLEQSDKASHFVWLVLMVISAILLSFVSVKLSKYVKYSHLKPEE